MIFLRPSTEHDLAAITEIYAHYVAHSTATFELEIPPLEEMAKRRQDVIAKGLPYLVLTVDDVVVGFAYANWFKPRAGYRYAVENSIYLEPRQLGKGWGRLLLAELLAQLERAGIRQVIAVIGGSDNHASIQLHAKMGFVPIGTLKDCGWKHNRWLDVVLMQCSLSLAATEAPC